MILILSPAKSLELAKEITCPIASIPLFQADTEPIAQYLKKLSIRQIENKFTLSKKLAELNYHRFQSFGTNESIKNSRQAIFTFDGDVYTGLDAYSLDRSCFDFAQDTIRILSGLYGILRPFDLMEPYRLEMGSDVSIGKMKSLYSYWSGKLTDSLSNDMAATSYLLLNLASIEYSKVVDRKILKGKVIDFDFLEEEKKEFKNISFFAKKARGWMARYIVDHRLTSIEDIKSFDLGGYQYHKRMSSDSKFVFSRKSLK